MKRTSRSNRKAEREVAKLHHQLHHLRGRVHELQAVIQGECRLVGHLLERLAPGETDSQPEA